MNFPLRDLLVWAPFAGHVPDDGAVFIYYAPHIGVTKVGSVGEIYRIGQSKATSCCGAAKAALGKLMNNEIKPDQVSELDYQMNTIEQIFLKAKDRILQSSNPLMEATEVMYEAIDERIQLLGSQTTYKCKYLILIGAILINGDHDLGSFTSIRRFNVIDLATKGKKNLIDVFSLKHR